MCPLSPLSLRNGIPWGLLSVVFATLALIQFLYLYKQKRVNRVSPNGLVLCLFGTAGSIATAIGIGGMGTYLGLGIVDTMSGNGEHGCVCLCLLGMCMCAYVCVCAWMCVCVCVCVL